MELLQFSFQSCVSSSSLFKRRKHIIFILKKMTCHFYRHHHPQWTIKKQTSRPNNLIQIWPLKRNWRNWMNLMIGYRKNPHQNNKPKTKIETSIFFSKSKIQFFPTCNRISQRINLRSRFYFIFIAFLLQLNSLINYNNHEIKSLKCLLRSLILELFYGRHGIWPDETIETADAPFYEFKIILLSRTHISLVEDDAFAVDVSSSNNLVSGIWGALVDHRTDVKKHHIQILCIKVNDYHLHVLIQFNSWIHFLRRYYDTELILKRMHWREIDISLLDLNYF